MIRGLFFLNSLRIFILHNSIRNESAEQSWKKVKFEKTESIYRRGDGREERNEKPFISCRIRKAEAVFLEIYLEDGLLERSLNRD